MDWVIYKNSDALPKVEGSLSSRGPLEFHRRLPGYVPTELREVPGLTRALGIGRLLVKDESQRMGLPAFKFLGASWASYRALCQLLGDPEPRWSSLEELVALFRPLGHIVLLAATEGNHGRAVARTARLFGLGSHIVVPSHIAPERLAAIQGEGARVTVVDGDYDQAVSHAARAADDRHLVISDTAYPGCETVPLWVIEGYSTIFHEIDEERGRRNLPHLDLVAVQIGVGSLAGAVASHYRGSSTSARILGVEPLEAACALTSVRAGRIVKIPGPHRSVMAGLNCGTPSLVAWPYLRYGIDLFTAIDDETVMTSIRELASVGVVAGESGAAGFAGLRAALTGPGSEEIRRDLRVDSETTALVIVTEGDTDPLSYARIVGRTAQEVRGFQKG